MHTRLVVADDDAAIRRLIGAALADYTVSGVARGDDALVLAQQELPDLVLLDVEMPGLDGLAVARALATGAATAAIPVVLCSGAGPDAAAAAHRLPNVFGFLAKPFSLKALRTVVDAGLEAGQRVPVAVSGATRAPTALLSEPVLWQVGLVDTTT